VSGPRASEVPPEVRVLLAASDRDAQRRDDHVRLHPGRGRDLAPVAILVDERLADVKEDCLDPHCVG
jgi:hypothetical protein